MQARAGKMLQTPSIQIWPGLCLVLKPVCSFTTLAVRPPIPPHSKRSRFPMARSPCRCSLQISVLPVAAQSCEGRKGRYLSEKKA